ncbi:hypothetical protein BHM03_00062594, partial [Ensete ventricosum]
MRLGAGSERREMAGMTDDDGREERNRGGRRRKRRPREMAMVKSGRRWPIDGERRATTNMVSDNEGGRQHRRLGATGDNDKGLADGDKGKGWATTAEGWPMIDKERKKGRDAEDSNNV